MTEADKLIIIGNSKPQTFHRNLTAFDHLEASAFLIKFKGLEILLSNDSERASRKFQSNNHCPSARNDKKIQ